MKSGNFGLVLSRAFLMVMIGGSLVGCNGGYGSGYNANGYYGRNYYGSDYGYGNNYGNWNGGGRNGGGNQSNQWKSIAPKYSGNGG